MKNITMVLAIVAMVFLLGGFVFVNSRDGVAENVIQDPTAIQGQTQKVVISQKDHNYYPREVRVKANQPVEITLDESLKGCLRSLSIKEFGVNEYARTSGDKITFIPDKKGTFTFSCAMGMGYGKLIVE